MRREDWQPSRSDRICEKHFLPCDYQYPQNLPYSSTLSRRFLKRDAVPSVFNFPEHLNKKHCPRQPPKKRSSDEQVSPSCKPSKVPKQHHNDHPYSNKLSPRKLKARYEKKLKQKNKTIKNLRKKNLRKEKKICDLISKLHAYQLLSEELSVTLNESFGHLTTTLIKNEAKNIDNATGSRYTEEVKEFATTLHFYSPRAYRFVRKALHLPHPATIRSWYVNVSCEPGFLQTPLEHVADKVSEGQGDCIILLDEMSIRKQIQWDRKNERFVGHVDYGTVKAEKAETEATNALVFMAAGLQKPWFVPIAYFLTNCLDGDILKQLLLEAISKVSEKGGDVHGVVFDGAPKNLAMAQKLGCDIANFDGSFDHPFREGKIHVILDICHMLKLTRNSLAHMGSFFNSSGGRISWEYIAALHKVQQEDILHLGNKLRAKHVQWTNHKMKVSVAAQTLSHSVSAAITFLRKLKMQKFKDSKATSDFILLINDMFDILNSKSKFGKNNKKPITKENIADIESFLNDGIDMLKSLKDQSGVSLAKGPRKMFVIGFCISALSILSISKTLLNRSVLPYEYVLTYRFSQDQIEMYFSKLRSRFGWNNNPTALQLKYGIRALLLRNKVESPSTANCVNVSDQDTTEMAKVDPRLSNFLLSTTIWRPDVLFYISGYIVKKLIDCIECPDCICALSKSSLSKSSLTAW